MRHNDYPDELEDSSEITAPTEVHHCIEGNTGVGRDVSRSTTFHRNIKTNLKDGAGFPAF